MKPVYDFSTTPEQRAAEQAKQDAAIAAAQVAALEASIKKPVAKKQDAPAVIRAKQGLVPAKKPAAKKSGKAGRVVGISADENMFLKTLLLDIIADHSYDEFIEKNKAAYDKLVARYN